MCERMLMCECEPTFVTETMGLGMYTNTPPCTLGEYTEYVYMPCNFIYISGSWCVFTLNNNIINNVTSHHAA